MGKLHETAMSFIMLLDTKVGPFSSKVV